MDIKQLMIEMGSKIKKGGKLSNFIRYDSFKYSSFFFSKEFKLETRHEHQVVAIIG